MKISGLIGTLSDASVRKTGVGGLPKPLTVSPVEILAIYDSAIKSSQIRMERDCEGQLIHCQAPLLAVEFGTANKEEAITEAALALSLGVNSPTAVLF